MLNNLFFELIQVSIGRRDALSRVPSAKEWCELYGLSVKQALNGVCFCGAQRLANEQRKEMPKGLMMQWFALAEGIKQRNEVMNTRCAEMQRLLDEVGFRSCVLKGQGVAELYNLNLDLNLNKNDNRNYKINLTLVMYRQSGDIYVWVDASRWMRSVRRKYGV